MYVLTAIFSVALAVTFVAWHRSERTLSIHEITTPQREGFYWLAILFTSALGTPEHAPKMNVRQRTLKAANK